MRRFARIFSVALITAGIVILADAGITLAWQEPLSAAYGSVQQGKAEDQFNSLQQSFQRDAEVVELGGGSSSKPESAREVRKRARQLAGIFEGRLKTGSGIGKIEIPSIGAGYTVVEGTDEASLQKGPGRYPTTALPGQGRTIGIAGHRTTYLAPFNDIDKISEGDRILLEMPYGRFTYEVTSTKIVDPSDVGIVDDVGRERLVLTACHPKYSAAQRYVVFADLADVSLPEPDGGISTGR